VIGSRSKLRRAIGTRDLERLKGTTRTRDRSADIAPRRSVLTIRQASPARSGHSGAMSAASVTDERNVGLGALAAAIGFAVVLFVDAPVLLKVAIWLGWAAFCVIVFRLVGLPEWKDEPGKKRLAARLLVIEAIVIAAVAAGVRIAIG
jgi:hypothetical protein